MSLLFLMMACSDYKLGSESALGTVAPDIEVSPQRVVFDPLPLSTHESRVVQVTNRGDGALQLDGALIDGGAFSLEGALPERLDPGEAVALSVVYTGTNPEDLGWLYIASDDPDTPEVLVDLAGAALFPELSVAPSPYDFGVLYPGCDRDVAIEIGNAGEASLTVESVGVGGEGFTLSGLPTPLTLAPGERVDVVLAFAGEWPGNFEGTVTVQTDIAGVGVATQTAAVASIIERTDEFLQPSGEIQGVDMLFYVDQSGSMNDDAANLGNNFGLLVESLQINAFDYNIMIATKDSGCHNQAIITPETDDAASLFRDAATGGGGSWTEAGLTIALSALEQTGAGDCNEGFRRGGAGLAVVLISDEPEQSRESWTYYLNAIQELVPEVVFSAIAGPVPSGCPTADPGAGYWEVVDATGGVFLEICDSDWGSRLDELPTTVVLPSPTDTFPLTEAPVVDTIEVRVDGLVASGWSYSEALNAVIFEVMPAPGAGVGIHYELAQICD